MSNKRIFITKGSLAYQQWGSPTSAKKILALHGWLDNSNSFNFLGPYLAELGYHVVAYDNIGHGYSSHETASSNNYSIAPYVGRCRAIMDALEWDKCNIVGHSLGASLGALFAGSHPDRVLKLSMIDGFTSPLTQPAERAAVNLRKAIDMEVNYQTKQRTRNGPKLYDTFQNAISARINSVSSYPGEQTLSVAAATTLVARGVSLSKSASRLELNLDSEFGREFQIEHPGDDEYIQDMTDLTSGPVYFRHDTKLFLPAHSHFTKYQMKSFIEGIKAETLIITAVNGWPPGNMADHLSYLRILNAKGLLTDITLPGSHHLHLDPKTAPLTAEAVALHFLKE